MYRGNGGKISDTKFFKETENFYFLENLHLRAHLIKKNMATQHKPNIKKNLWQPDFLKFQLAIYTNYLISTRFVVMLTGSTFLLPVFSQEYHHLLLYS